MYVLVVIPLFDEDTVKSPEATGSSPSHNSTDKYPPEALNPYDESVIVIVIEEPFLRYVYVLVFPLDTLTTGAVLSILNLNTLSLEDVDVIPPIFVELLM